MVYKCANAKTCRANTTKIVNKFVFVWSLMSTPICPYIRTTEFVFSVNTAKGFHLDKVFSCCVHDVCNYLFLVYDFSLHCKVNK